MIGSPARCGRIPGLCRSSVAAAAVALALQAGVAKPAAATESPGQPLMLGVSRYPEQWPQSRWEADLTLMEQAHVRFVRIAEFSWSSLEPHEGAYDFTWLDRAERHHISVVLGTPTAGPPAWLTAPCPDTLRMERDGRRAEHGQRQQFDFASPRHRIFAADMARRMAQCTAKTPT